MSDLDFNYILNKMKNQEVDRPNKSTSGTLSGHAAGEPFEKLAYKELKEKYPGRIFKQYEYLNDIYLKNPTHITVKQRKELFDSPTALFLFSRGDNAIRYWSPQNIFDEKQNDTADILYYDHHFYDIIDIKTRNIKKGGQPPNIISAYKLANMCALMLDNEEFDNIEIDYIEIDWIEDGDKLKCTDTHHGRLFKANPETLYINWSAGMQIQFHVSELDQSWKDSRREWAIEYLRKFVNSAEDRCTKMRKTYIEPFLRYIQ
ncbi:MAG: HincII family type II restriction endonuclease [Muribaculaceae bacterium]|nr:HincII family type II restriction endonuclease [Muribaculaceae bacterium]